AVISRSQAGQAVANVHTHLSRLTDLTFVSELPRGADEPEVIFLAGAHGYASEVAPALLDTGIPVVDLSADFRLKDPVSFEKFYGPPTAAFARRSEFVYGLPELFREQIESSRRCGRRGSWPTRRPSGSSPSPAPRAPACIRRRRRTTPGAPPRSSPTGST